MFQNSSAGKYATAGKEQSFPATVKMERTGSDPNYDEGFVVTIVDNGLLKVLPEDLHTGPVAGAIQED